MNMHAEAREEGGSASHKMSSILALKRKLQHELQAHLRMQHQLLTQLNQVVLPAVERLHTEGEEPNGAARNGGASSQDVKVEASGVKVEAMNADGDEGEEEDDDDDDDDDSEEGPSPPKRRKPSA